MLGARKKLYTSEALELHNKANNNLVFLNMYVYVSNSLPAKTFCSVQAIIYTVLAKKLNNFFGSLSKPLDFLICREYIYGNIEILVWCFRKYILYIWGNGAYSIGVCQVVIYIIYILLAHAAAVENNFFFFFIKIGFNLIWSYICCWWYIVYD